ncbi:hypothetical protein [Methylocapsa sp. S129]|uniref:hypothetical protein n=1 Tax=Methylocapsa sp. S129 TaxID=1641869 RepID=UPI00131C8F94|nr:hypothetical protein [Methylocapsa sp. S129]
MVHHFKALLIGVGVYGGIGATMVVLWGAVDAAIIGVAAIVLGAGRRLNNFRPGAGRR